MGTAVVDAVFGILITLAFLQGLYALWEGFRFLLFARRRLGTETGFYAPRATVFCPCKGLEIGLEENLLALLRQDYNDYEVIFAISSSADPARNLLDRLVARFPGKARLAVAGRPQDRGEKVHNLLAALELANEHTEVFVFADSDGRPPRHWLGRVVGALHDRQWAAVTTYRWYLPGSSRLPAVLASAWNAPIATLLGGHSHNFCWGGGTAIRKETFFSIKAIEYWQHAVSDDYALTIALKHANGSIAYLPECIVPSRQNPDWEELLEWTTRQIIITRVYAPKLWLLAALSHIVHCGAVGLGVILILRHLLLGFGVLNLFLLLLLLEGLAVFKGALRLVAMTELLPAHKDELLEYWWVPTLLAPVVPWLYFLNFLVSTFWRRITWKGVRYRLHSPWKTTILRPGQ